MKQNKINKEFHKIPKNSNYAHILRNLYESKIKQKRNSVASKKNS